MRQDGFRRVILVIAASCALSESVFAQTATKTDAAIAELRRLIDDQRAALDRQARIIEEQGRTLTALQQQVDAAARTHDLAAPAPAAVVSVAAQAPPPSLAAALEASLDIVSTEPERRTQLAARVTHLREAFAAAGIVVPAGFTQIIPAVLGDNDRAPKAAGRHSSERALPRKHHMSIRVGC